MKPINDAEGKILKVTRDLICQKGLEEFNMRNVSELAEVSIGTLYNYFQSKADLVISVMKHLLIECCSLIQVDDSKDIFQIFESAYQSMNDYLKVFKGSLMRDMFQLASSKEMSHEMIELQHMNIIHQKFLEIVNHHEAEISPDVFQSISKDQLVELIMVNFTNYLMKGHQDYQVLGFLLKKLVS